jgi:hypothetical protein
MDRHPLRSTWLPALALAALATPAFAEVTMNGDVTLDYYVANTDSEGFEHTATDFSVQQIDNTGGDTGPLSLQGRATQDPDPASAGSDIGYAPIGPAPADSTLDNFGTTVNSDDIAPGEYYTHVLLQDDSAPGTFDDSRTMTPRMLWRGGLEAVGPLTLYPHAGGTRVTVDFAELRNNRIDSRYTNDIVLTLYATYGYGPASQGYTLCSTTVPGIYAGDRQADPSFDCAINDLPNGDYSLHLEVAEAGGRGGSSSLDGPNQYFRDGAFDDGSTEVYAAALSPWMLAPFLVLALVRRYSGEVHGRLLTLRARAGERS